MPFRIIRNDITRLNVQAVVSPINEKLRTTGGVSLAIMKAAGYERVMNDLAKIKKLKKGAVVVSPGYDLCKYIFHTAGPVWHAGCFNETSKLARCYENILRTAYDMKIESLAFPLISSGVNGFPVDKAVDIAVNTVKDSPFAQEMDICLVLFGNEASHFASKYYDVEAYIDDVYTESFRYEASRRYDDNLVDCSMSAPCAAMPTVFHEEKICADDISSAIRNIDKSFSDTLLALIDEKGLKDSAVYKKANIDRKLFSKIRNNPDYKPKKTTAIAFAIALELDLEGTNELLSRAGYVLSHSNKGDIIVEYFIKRKHYDIFDINEALFTYDQYLLGV